METVLRLTIENGRPDKKIWEARIQEKRKRERPKLTCDGVTDEIFQEKGNTRIKAKLLTRNRKIWAKLVNK